MEQKLKIYIATPVNARNEATLQEKKEKAALRCKMLKEKLGKEFPNADVVCSFDVCPIAGEPIEEHTAMGRCVDLLMTCDSIYLDEGWEMSSGCNVEYFTAKTYGLFVMGYETVNKIRR